MCPIEVYAVSSFVYSVPGHMVDGSEFTCGIYFGIFPQLMHIKYFVYVALSGMFLPGTYMPLPW